MRHPAIVAIAQLAARGRRIVLPSRDVRQSMSGARREGGGVEAMRIDDDIDINDDDIDAKWGGNG